MKYLLFLSLSFLLSFSGFTQVKNTSTLAIDDIMKGEDFVGYLPTNISWSENSNDIYFSWNPDNDTIRSTYKVNVATKAIEKMTFNDLKAKTSHGDFSSDFTMKVYAKGGDIFLMNTHNYSIKRITHTVERESNPVFSGDNKSIVYKKGNNLYQWDINSGTTKQLTYFKTGKKPYDKKSSSQEEWLENDQLALFDILSEREHQKQAKQYRREQSTLKQLEPTYIGKWRLANLAISPSLKYVVYKLYKAPNRKNTIVPDFVTKSGYTKDLNARSKVGSKQYNYQTWILNLNTNKTYQVKTNEIEGIKNKPEFLKDYTENLEGYSNTYDEPKPVNFGNPIFSEDDKTLINITSQDYKDRWIMTINLEDGSLNLVDYQHDDAWIGGPGIGWFSRPEMGWLNQETVWYKSEKTGYAHLYTTNVTSGKTSALTKGQFEIQTATLSKDKSTFYITSNKVSPHETHFYHLSVNGGKLHKITTKKGGHEVTISPDETKLAIRYSYKNKPWELYIMDNTPKATMTQLTNSTSEDFESYSWKDPEIISFKARDGAKVPATLFKPNPEKSNGAAIIFVHGAGYLQNVHQWWSSYYREYMFHNLLADNGYTVLNIDFRASNGYGRDWRTAIYRHMGGKDLTDQIDGAKYLVEHHNISKEKLGIYGGSYGGFITLMAMFKAPKTFKSGAALRSVTDWAHYNHGYTANILNTPVEDPKAYKRSSPIYFADGLKGHLLMLHGMVDTNVQFQDVVRLSQRLIELKKDHWELALFPMEGHGFIESSSWSDEYRRIFKLFQETLNN
ncbi:S9 family peptidase [Mangrovimonas cancribranchiae]|uniref:Prolyl oligopeptidase family serine peptidase n=1 Tax=Mangrovimonas cancribranchiae TaxID=3080055 RepID=A0AAU6NVC6_9FLAO